MLGRTRKVNKILNECLEGVLFHGETVEECLQRHPRFAGELKPLLETALEAKKAVAIQPRAEFKDRARQEFHAALQRMGHQKSRSFLGRALQPHWATVLAGVLVLLLVGGGGTVAAASNSMPDDFLYPVKLATEQVRLAFTTSDLGKAELYAELIDKRVEEIVCMAAENKTAEVEETTQRLNVCLVRMAVITLSTAPARLGGTQLVPAEVTAEEFAADDASLSTDQRAKLKGMVTSNAIQHSTRLREALEDVPEPTKQALLRAIAVSESGYNNILESFD